MRGEKFEGKADGDAGDVQSDLAAAQAELAERMRSADEELGADLKAAGLQWLWWIVPGFSLPVRRLSRKVGPRFWACKPDKLVKDARNEIYGRYFRDVFERRKDALYEARQLLESQALMYTDALARVDAALYEERVATGEKMEESEGDEASTSPEFHVPGHGPTLSYRQLEAVVDVLRAEILPWHRNCLNCGHEVLRRTRDNIAMCGKCGTSGQFEWSRSSERPSKAELESMTIEELAGIVAKRAAALMADEDVSKGAAPEQEGESEVTSPVPGSHRVADSDVPGDTGVDGRVSAIQAIRMAVAADAEERAKATGASSLRDESATQPVLESLEQAPAAPEGAATAMDTESDELQGLRVALAIHFGLFFSNDPHGNRSWTAFVRKMREYLAKLPEKSATEPLLRPDVGPEALDGLRERLHGLANLNFAPDGMGDVRWAHLRDEIFRFLREPRESPESAVSDPEFDAWDPGAVGEEAVAPKPTGLVVQSRGHSWVEQQPGTGPGFVCANCNIGITTTMAVLRGMVKCEMNGGSGIPVSDDLYRYQVKRTAELTGERDRQNTVIVHHRATVDQLREQLRTMSTMISGWAFDAGFIKTWNDDLHPADILEKHIFRGIMCLCTCSTHDSRDLKCVLHGEDSRLNDESGPLGEAGRGPNFALVDKEPNDDSQAYVSSQTAAEASADPRFPLESEPEPTVFEFDDSPRTITIATKPHDLSMRCLCDNLMPPLPHNCPRHSADSHVRDAWQAFQKSYGPQRDGAVSTLRWLGFLKAYRAGRGSARRASRQAPR